MEDAERKRCWVCCNLSKIITRTKLKWIFASFYPWKTEHELYCYVQRNSDWIKIWREVTWKATKINFQLFNLFLHWIRNRFYNFYILNISNWIPAEFGLPWLGKMTRMLDRKFTTECWRKKTVLKGIVRPTLIISPQK